MDSDIPRAYVFGPVCVKCGRVAAWQEVSEVVLPGMEPFYICPECVKADMVTLTAEETVSG